MKTYLLILTAATLILGSHARGADTEAPGAFDASFRPGISPSYATVQAVAAQADGRVLLGGDFTSVDGAAVAGIARLRHDGSLDDTFARSPGADGYVNVIHAAADGTVLVGGTFSSINGAGWRGLARLTSAGLPDPAFSQFGGISQAGVVNAIAVQTDGKILVGGSFNGVNGTTRTHIARLFPNGSLDPSFNALLNGKVKAIAVRPDGRILIGGEFTQVNSQARTHIAQLNSDGTTDAGFNASADWDVNSIVLLDNGQAVIGGRFWQVNGFNQNKLARLNPDGSRDATFPASATGDVNRLALQPNGKIVVGGDFGAINGTGVARLARLTADGYLDPEFQTGTGPNGNVQDLALAPDGRIVIVGAFTTVSTFPQPFAARIWGDPPPPVTVVDSARIWTAVEIGWDSQEGATYQVQWSHEAQPAIWNDFGAPLTGTGGFMRVFDSTRENPRRFYRVVRVE